MSDDTTTDPRTARAARAKAAWAARRAAGTATWGRRGSQPTPRPSPATPEPLPDPVQGALAWMEDRMEQWHAHQGYQRGMITAVVGPSWAYCVSRVGTYTSSPTAHIIRAALPPAYVLARHATEVGRRPPPPLPDADAPIPVTP